MQEHLYEHIKKADTALREQREGIVKMMRKKYPHVLGRHGKSKILEDIRVYGQGKEGEEDG
jgi:hypothetical protein